MEEQKARWQISNTLRERGFKYVGPGPDQYRGRLAVGHEWVEVEINVPDLDFVTFPTVTLVDREKLSLPLLAHLEQTGLCFADRSLLRLDPYQPGASVLRTLAEAERTLVKSMAGRARDEISQEYPLYWKGEQVFIVIPKGTNAKCAVFAIDTERDQKLLVKKDCALPGGYKVGNEAAIFQSTGIVGPGINRVVPATLSDLKAWFGAQESLDIPYKAVLKALASGRGVFFSASNGWIGCMIQRPADLKKLWKDNPGRRAFVLDLFEKRSGSIDLIRCTGREASLDFVTERNLKLGSASLKGKRIAVVGCGAIGSHLSRYLVQAGAGNSEELLVVDNQTLVPGNLGRHLLNFSDLGRPKATALAAELRRFHPDTRILSFDAEVKDVWLQLMSADLIIDATGVEMVGEFMNAKALARRQAGRRCNVLHCFLFANGVAAQSYLNIGQGACYRCLRPELTRPWNDDPRIDKSHDGDLVQASCGDGPYLPFAVDAPVVAACMGLRATLEFFAGKKLRTFRSVPLDLSRARKEWKEKELERDERCPACGTCS